MAGLSVEEQICLFPRRQQIIESLYQDKQITQCSVAIEKHVSSQHQRDSAREKK